MISTTSISGRGHTTSNLPETMQKTKEVKQAQSKEGINKKEGNKTVCKIIYPRNASAG